MKAIYAISLTCYRVKTGLRSHNNIGILPFSVFNLAWSQYSSRNSQLCRAVTHAPETYLHNVADCSVVGHDLGLLRATAHIPNWDLTCSQVLELSAKSRSRLAVAAVPVLVFQF